VQELIAGGRGQLEYALVSRLQHFGIEPALTDLAFDYLAKVFVSNRG
jgi:hypothetical protein